ncbi:MAG: aspartate--tRNA ligase [Acutalibacteraceae bacterium]|nr:aspartate--tRNA ligase [Acutalibacteraceae bacterium]
MAEFMTGMKRTHYCGELRISDVGKTVTLFGWVAKQRDLGQLIFIDLRDRTGVTQLSFDDTTEKSVFEKAAKCRSEFVLGITGTVLERSAKSKKIATGDIEVKVSELRILGESETPPFEITENCKTGEATRLQYRYLDLRRPDLQQNIILRHKIAKATRDYFDERGFIEIETPMLIKSTPEGARDFLVPSRIHKGSFYALPQSPQIYKQLCMVAGFDKYMQIARCFRDEDLRADRQPEFTQIDIEMSFVDMEDILELGEGFIKYVFKKSLDIDIPTPFPRYTYNEVMERFGSDKPDTRFGMELFNLTDVVKDTDFVVFKSAIEGGGSVRGITAKNAVKTYSRKEIDKLTETAKGIGAKGMAWIRMTDDGVASSFGKFMTDEQMNAVIERAGAQKGDVVFIIADTNDTSVMSILGALRLEAARKLDIIKDGFNFLWVVEFPFFEFDKESGEWVAMHHPFTSPTDEALNHLEGDKSKVYAKAYDMVLNGIELSSGSIRITNPDLQKRMFSMLGLSDEEAYRKFGFLTDAFKYGAPPHGGMGIGLDRLVMQMIKASTLRDVVAFPKVQNASELMTNAPSMVDEAQLAELGIGVIGEAKQ